MRRPAAVFLATALLVAALFWCFAGRSLGYDVFNGGVYSHSEPYSQSGRILITAAVALVAASLATWLVRAFRRAGGRGSGSS